MSTKGDNSHSSDAHVAVWSRLGVRQGDGQQKGTEFGTTEETLDFISFSIYLTYTYIYIYIIYNRKKESATGWEQGVCVCVCQQRGLWGSRVWIFQVWFSTQCSTFACGFHPASVNPRSWFSSLVCGQMIFFFFQNSEKWTGLDAHPSAIDNMDQGPIWDPCWFCLVFILNEKFEI